MGKRGYDEFNFNVPLLLSIANVMYPIRVFDSVVRCGEGHFKLLKAFLVVSLYVPLC